MPFSFRNASNFFAAHSRARSSELVFFEPLERSVLPFWQLLLGSAEHPEQRAARCIS
jgi:hypothetical protein